MTKKVVSYPPHEFAQLPIFILRYIRSEGEQQYLHPIFEARGRCLPWVRFKVVRNSSDGTRCLTSSPRLLLIQTSKAETLKL